jgi:hypothetical protein
MDYICVGSNGFAQLGDPLYPEKNAAEMNYLLGLIREKFPIPERLQTLCRYAVKAFSHDFGNYHEIVLHYDDITIEEDPETDPLITMSEEQLAEYFDKPIPESEQTLSDIFWNWFNEVESFDLESEEITEAIKARYLRTLNLSKSEHLSITSKRIAS